MKRTLRPLLGAAAGFGIVATIGMVMTVEPDRACAATARQPTTSFSEDILPLLKWRCGSCHTPGAAGHEKSGLDLNSYAGVMKGTKFGPMVVARDPEASNLMLLLDWRVAPAIRMPHGQKKLSICDRDAIRTWIREGAKDN